ncbi:MAG: hypothetical protein KF850_10620 [Labilithrix sp.]|nr:hypothetical protein [Labilithrix sp.]MBX3212476.1 hypothetical protein [Labilithrix sp.]
MKLSEAWAKAKAVRSETLVRAACVLGLVALPFMVTSVFVPTVWPVLVALSFGQALGTLSFALYLVAIARDLQLARRLRSRDVKAPEP